MSALENGVAIAIESSTRRASVAVRRGETTLFSSLESDRAHASDLVPALDRLIRELGASPRDIRAVVVGTGPGSYTGLRVGIATALGLARASNARILGVPSGETLAFELLEPGLELIFLLDARSGEIYYARYRRVNGEVLVVDAPRVVEPGDAPRLTRDPVVIAGDATVADVARLDQETRARLRTDAHSSATALLALGLARLERGIEHTLADIEPLYLRPFAATQRRR